MSESICFRVNARPVAKPRMTQADKRIKRPVVVKYWAWAEEIRLALKQQYPTLRPISTSARLTCRFYLPMPKSWSKRKMAEKRGAAHAQRPDLKNLIAGLEDALNGIAWRDDSLITEFSMCDKIWSSQPGVAVRIIEA